MLKVSGIFPNKRSLRYSTAQCGRLWHNGSGSPLMAGRAAGANEASCVSSLIWELNNFPCGSTISSFYLDSHFVRWAERWKGKKLPPWAENVLPLSIQHSGACRPEGTCSPEVKKHHMTLFKKIPVVAVLFPPKTEATGCSFCSFLPPTICVDPFQWSIGNRELINGLLQGSDTRAGLQISVSMCLLFNGWCINILNLNRRRSAWWGLPYGYSGAQPGGPSEMGWPGGRDGGGGQEQKISSSVWHHPHLWSLWKVWGFYT